MEGEKVEKVVPLAAREETDGARFRYPAEERELIESVILVVEAGLAISFRSLLACSTADISCEARWMVDRLAGPRLCSKPL